MLRRVFSSHGRVSLSPGKRETVPRPKKRNMALMGFRMYLFLTDVLIREFKKKMAPITLVCIHTQQINIKRIDIPIKYSP